MPIYEYKCANCGEETEILQGMRDPAPICRREGCRGSIMQKKVSRSNFQLKGGGWYKDGYSG